MRDGPAIPVRVYLDGEKIAELHPEDDAYSYVLPSGRTLASRALYDHHELLFVAEEFEADGIDGIVRFSCYLPLYRSMRDNLDLPRGVAVLFFTMAFSVIAVVLKGRRFPWR
jgi:hypothetical protein